jgi:D-alanyl-D-alanine carboxypeptidase
LLNHTSGIQDYTRNPDWINLVMSGNTPRTFQERVQLIDPKLKPLNKFHYSNSNYLFLEKIVEKITGNTYDMAFNQFYEDQGLSGIHMSTAVDTTQTFFGQELSQVSDVTATQETYGYAGDVHATSQELLLFMKKVFVDRTILTPASMVQLQKFVAMEPMTIPIGKGEISH